MVKAIAICEAPRGTAFRHMDIIVIESDSHIIISSINEQMDAPSMIINHVICIRNLARNF